MLTQRRYGIRMGSPVPCNPMSETAAPGATIISLVRPEPRTGGRNSGQTSASFGGSPSGLRARHYSPRAEKAYVGWIRRFILFHGKRHPETMAEAEIGAYLSSLV